MIALAAFWGVIITLALTLLATPLAVEAQSAGRIARIGLLSFSDPSANRHLIEAFREGLRELGYVERRNILIEERFAEGSVQWFPTLAAELVGLNVDVIVVGTQYAIQAVRDATKTIPIVMAAGGDPVRAKFVVGLARPGGNITGLATFVGPEIAGKQLELVVSEYSAEPVPVTRPGGETR